MPEAHPASDPRWQRILSRDRSADGHFWYSVTTTGVYCRPSCASRAARPEHVRIHATLAEARATGCRPCRRCNPEGASGAELAQALVERACRRIEAAETAPTLAELADEAELSQAYFHRLFRTVTGLTPKGYAKAVRAGAVRSALQRGEAVTTAAHGAGFGSSAQFYAGARDMLGMAPARYRAGGAEERLEYAAGACSLGTVMVACSASGVAAILLGDDPGALLAELRGRFPRAELAAADAARADTVAQVVALVDDGIALDLPLDIRGTAFQQRVWQALRQVPAGEVRSYADIARAIGTPASVRAVAGACAANALAVAIPCHRVVRADGGLSGYRWGTDRKRALLEREGKGGWMESTKARTASN